MRASVDQRIAMALRRSPLDLHGLTEALWPCLDAASREAALTAVYYTRSRVQAMATQGRIISVEGRLLLAEEEGEAGTLEGLNQGRPRGLLDPSAARWIA